MTASEAAAVGARQAGIGVTTDVLIPPFEMYEPADTFTVADDAAELRILDLETGHDSFLIHPDAFGPPIQAWLERAWAPDRHRLIRTLG